MKNVVVKDTHLTFGGVAYFRGHAEEVQIGSLGEIRKSGARMNYLEVKDRLVVPGDVIIEATTVNIDFNKISNTDIGIGAKAILKGIPVELKLDTDFNRLRSGELKLVKFSVSSNHLKKTLNNSPDFLRDLNDWGKNARIAHQVFVIIDAELADAFNRGIGFKLAAGVKGIEAKLEAGVSTSGITKVTISKDTCFAYLLLSIKWDKKDPGLRIADLNDDQWGLG